jgi:hypothetical protein
MTARRITPALAALLVLALLAWLAARRPQSGSLEPDAAGAVARPDGGARTGPAGLLDAEAAPRAAVAEEAASGAAADRAADDPRGFDPYDYGVRGRVLVGGQSKPDFSGAMLSLSNRDGPLEQEAVEPDGRFERFQLGPGRWTVVVEVPGVGLAEQTVLLSEAEPVAEVRLALPPPHELEVVLATTADPDAPAAGWRARVSVVAYPGDREAPHELDELARRSVSSTHLLEERTLVLRMLLPEGTPTRLRLESHDLVLDERRVEPWESRVDWSLDPPRWPPALASLSVRPRDAATREPVEASVHLKVGARGQGTPRPERLEDGALLFEGLPAGWTLVTADAGGYARGEQWIRLAPGERHELDGPPLRPAVSISGLVVGPAGPCPAELACWRWDPASRQVEPASYRRVARAPGGRFRLTDVPAGVYLLRSIGPDEGGTAWRGDDGALVSAFVEVDARRPVEDVRVPLRPGARIVLHPLAPPPSPWRYRIDDALGRRLRSGVLRSSAAVAHVLAPGRHRVLVTDGEEVVADRAVELLAEPVVVDL